MRLLMLCLLGLVFSFNAQAESTPQGPTLLTVSGAIQPTASGQPVRHFDRAQLEALEQASTRTHTPWTEEAHLYQGVLFRALIEAVGASPSGTLRLTALNDFSADIPVEDLLTYPVILATHKDGRVLRVRDRGPLFVIYPFDTYPQLETEMYYNRSVWQVRHIEFLP